MTTRLPESEAVRRLHAQYATARALAESASLREAAPRVLQAIRETLGWEHGALWRVDAAAGVLRCVETWNPPFLPGRILRVTHGRGERGGGGGDPGRSRGHEDGAPGHRPRRGRVAEVRVREGQQVDAGTVLAVLAEDA